jgi:hypothetical protein
MNPDQREETVERGNIISTYVTDALKSDLLELALTNERSLSAEIRLALKRHVALAKQVEAEDVA